MGKRKAEDGDIVVCNVRNSIMPPHKLFGKVIGREDDYYLVDLWFFHGLPQSFAQVNPGYRAVYKIRPMELTKLTDQSEENIRELASQAERRAIHELGPNLKADDPKSVTKWLQRDNASRLPDYNPDDFMNMPEVDWKRTIYVDREFVKYPDELKKPRVGMWHIDRADWALHVGA